MNYLIYSITLLVLLIGGIIVYFTVKRNYFNKHKYVRLVKYNDDMTISISYIKHTNFNQDHSILINPKHVYNYKGYTSVVITSKANESINPIDFDSKFDSKDFKSAMKSKLIAETFASLKVEKFDKIMMLLLLNGIQLLAIVYMIYTGMNGVS